MIMEKLIFRGGKLMFTAFLIVVDCILKFDFFN